VPNCRNCEQSITAEIKFCPRCGQKNTDGKIKVWNFLVVFISQVFNIESKLFKTMRDLFIPGKLTIEYFKGKRKAYFHPLRLFFVLAISYLALSSFLLNNTDFFSKEANGTSSVDTLLFNPLFHKKIYYSNLFHHLDSLNNVYYQTQRYDSLTYTHINWLVGNALGKYKEYNDSLTISYGIRKPFTIASIDAIELNHSEIAKKYKIEGFRNAFVLKQHLRVYKIGLSNLNDFIRSNLLWAALLMMPFLALLLMLFYFKQKHFYVEHLVFSFHIHSFIFLLFTLVALIIALGSLIIHFFNLRLVSFILFLVIPLYVIFAIRKVYGQRWSTTLLKFTGIIFCYALLFVMFSTLTIMLSLIFF